MPNRVDPDQLKKPTDLDWQFAKVGHLGSARRELKRLSQQQ